MGMVTLSIFTIILSAEVIMGNLGNGLIILVNCLDLVKRRKLSAADHMLTALAISRLVLLWLLFTRWWTYMFHPTFFMNVQMVRVIYIIWIVTCHFNVWLATCLSIFYYLKIANFSNSIFLYLKWRVKKVVLVTLLVSLVLLFLNHFQSNIHLEVWINGHKRNMSHKANLPHFAKFSKLLVLNNAMFTLVPFAVSLTTFLLLIFSLWRHLKRMQHSSGGSRDVSTTAHTMALWTVIAFLLLYTIFFLSLLGQLWRSEVQSMLYFCFSQIAEIAFPSVHSLVLILGNSKLRQASLSLFRWPKCESKDAESSGP